MELELGQLDLRYGSLYAREKREERQAVTAVSAERAGPVVVVREGERWVVVEGFATVRARHRLKHDTVEATVWETGSARGLALRERLRRGRRPSAVEEGWLVTHLAKTEGWSPEEIGHWTGRPPGWVRSREEVVRQLPETVQERVRRGEIDGAVASGPLLALSRSSQRASERLGGAIAGKGLTRRQVSDVVEAWRRADAEGRERLLADPVLYVKARQAHPGRQELLRRGRALLATSRRLETEMTGVDEASRRRVQGILKETLGVLERMLGTGGEESASSQAARGDPGAVGAQGLSARQIAKVLKISRPSVKKVVESGTETVARALRPSRLEEHQEEIEELTKTCKGNLVRVHEELTEQGTPVSYQALTAFVRSQAPPPTVAGPKRICD